MAELIEMEKVAGRYESKHDLMQDIPQRKNESIDVRDHYDDEGGADHKSGSPRMSSNSNAKTKAHNTINNTENVFAESGAEQVEVQTKAITSQGRTLNEQTGLMKDQSNKLDSLNLTMEKLYSLLYKEHTRPIPKYQETPTAGPTPRANDKPDANGQADGFGSIVSDIADMFGGGEEKKGKKGNKGKKAPKIQTTGGGLKGFGGKMWGAAKSLGGSVSGLGGAAEGLGSRVMSGAKGMFAGGGGGWRGKVAKGVLGAGAAAVGYKGLESLGGLGAVSAMFESGKGGVGTISTGKGDHGGVSYGAHQLSSKSGTMAKFLRSEQGAQYADKFAGLQPGTPAFDAAYKQVVGNDAKGFEEAQAGFMKATHYDPAARKLQSDTGLDVSKRSRALQELVYSTSTQYGGGSSVLAKALAGKDASSMSDEELISTMQDYKRDNVGTNFKSSSAAVQASVAKRAENEKATLQKILADEKKNPQGVLKGEEVKGVDGNKAADIVQGKVKPADTTVGIMPMQAQDIKADSAIPENADPEVTTQTGLTGTQQVGAGLAVAGVAKTGVDATKGVSAIKGIASGAETVGLKSAAKVGGKLLGPVASVGIDGMRAASIINDDTLAKQEKERELAGVGGSMGGAVAGGVIGGTIGSAVPIVGTAIGGIGGAIAGSIYGEEGVKAGMDYMLGTPEERQAKAAQGMVINSPMLQGEHSTLPSAPVTMPSVKDLMTVPGAKPTSLNFAPTPPKPLGTPVTAPNQKISGIEAAAALNPKKEDDISPEELAEWQKWLGGSKAPMPTPKPQTQNSSPSYNNEHDVLKATTLPVAPGAPSFAKAAQTVEAGPTDKLAAATQSLADSAAKLSGIQPKGPESKPGMPGAAPAGMPALDSKPLSSPAALNPASPASPAFYNSEPAISQRAANAAAPIAKTAPTPVAAMPAREASTRQPFDTVQNVRMAVDQPQQSAAPSGGGKPAGPGGASGGKGNDKPTLDEFPVNISDFGLLFVNSGFM